MDIQHNTTSFVAEGVSVIGSKTKQRKKKAESWLDSLFASFAMSLFASFVMGRDELALRSIPVAYWQQERVAGSGALAISRRTLGERAVGAISTCATAMAVLALAGPRPESTHLKRAAASTCPWRRLSLNDAQYFAGNLVVEYG